ncbi:RidA family protein [Actinomyces minihominis]|uniref:RidA family protein n=1 Tax=Actinomyces minihominis TaxID=2002838 RepID=UPI000C088036|nr:RidA family protein [Actinomyces minihominis]
MTISQRLTELGIELPPVPAPVAAYAPAVIVGNTVKTSGQLPMKGGELLLTGRCGTVAVTDDLAYVAARQCALNAISAAASVVGGVDNLVRAVKVVGFVSSTEDYFAQPSVINGASDLLQGVFGSRHARSAVGVAALPLNATVEVEVEFEFLGNDI